MLGNQMQHPLDEMKKWLAVKLGREVTVSQVTLSGNRYYLADYISHRAPATKLVSRTEDGAIGELFNYLFTLPPDQADGTKE